MMRQRPVLTASWTELLVLNFRVPVELVARVAPPGTEADTFDGEAYVSVVGFRFHRARLFGLPIPAHTKFVEINLRTYVRRQGDGHTRRGVVFVKEIAPRRAVSAAAKWLYNENYITRPMRSNITIADTYLSPGDTIEYAWRSKETPLPCREGSGEGSHSVQSRRARHSSRKRVSRWNRLAARVAGPLKPAAAGSFEEFIIDNYWGYVRGRDGRSREYQVLHAPWRVARADDIVWNCDAASTYDPPFAEYLAAPPANALAVNGSAIQLFRGRCI
jgi:uncharacterized protein YqjF (DUF2071 family)